MRNAAELAQGLKTAATNAMATKIDKCAEAPKPLICACTAPAPNTKAGTYKGKTNKDVGDILGSSPMTVKKHLERVFIKLGVETRTAAAGKATARIAQLQPQFSG